MMDHIINFDWNYREPEEYFIKPEDLDNSVTERILRNKFRDPLISSDEETDDNRALSKIDWDKVFMDSREHNTRQRVYVPGLPNPSFKYLKLSAMTAQQQQQSLKVIYRKYPHKARVGYVPKPTEEDIKVYESIKEIYEKEQKEYLEWAKFLWISDHCRRALRPKPRVESVYEAHFKMKAAEIKSYPKTLRVAAQIPLETTDNDEYEMNILEDLFMVNIDELPEVACPMRVTEKLTIMKPSPTPEPCPVHPCKFVLPTERSVPSRTLSEAHRSLARLAGERGAACVASESALRCLQATARAWTLPVRVADVHDADGEACNVIVLGSEVPLLKEPAPARTYRAFKHMLDHAFVPDTEMCKLRYSNIEALRRSKKSNGVVNNTAQQIAVDMGDELSDEDEDNMMVIDAAEDDEQTTSPDVNEDEGLLATADEVAAKQTDDDVTTKQIDDVTKKQADDEVITKQTDDVVKKQTDEVAKKQTDDDVITKQTDDVTKKQIDDVTKKQADDGVITKHTGDDVITKQADEMTKEECTCKGTLFEYPPPRSYRKWRVRNKSTDDNIDVIIHCAHRFKSQCGTREVLLEPLPEYQLEVGASAQPEDVTGALALALRLRDNATLVNVRVNGATGDVISLESYTAEQLQQQQPQPVTRAAERRLHCALRSLRGLLPGHYALRHEASHGPNALLYAARARTGDALELRAHCAPPTHADEAAAVAAPPALLPAPLPAHRHRRMLPLAFPYYPNMVAPEPRRPATRQRTPPQALQWPKKKNKKKKTRQN